MKFSGKVSNGPTNKRLNFDDDAYCETGKTCLGGGMHCPSSCSRLECPDTLLKQNRHHEEKMFYFRIYWEIIASDFTWKVYKDTVKRIIATWIDTSLIQRQDSGVLVDRLVSELRLDTLNIDFVLLY